MARFRDHGGAQVSEPQTEPDHDARCALLIAMAVDLLVLAVQDRFDVAVLCSSDPDLEPALNAVLDHTWKSVEVAAWRVELGPSARLHVSGEKINCHWLDRPTYENATVSTAAAKPRSGTWSSSSDVA
ncbi:MAG TPA: NYN domain-containing protein [Acidimicrobiales bacterium]|nr:NYN domain-containing protein [Acidimicrobiales bacterium]